CAARPSTPCPYPTLFGSILGDGLFHSDARLVEHRLAAGQALDQSQPFQLVLFGERAAAAKRALAIDQPGIIDKLGQHHSDGLQRDRKSTRLNSSHVEISD